MTGEGNKHVKENSDERRTMSSFKSPRSDRKNETYRNVVRSPEERRETLRSFLTTTQSLQDFTPKTVKRFEEMINETDTMTLEATMEDKAACQDEVLMDSQIMTASSRVLKSATATLTKELSPYDTHEFAEKLLRYVYVLPDTTVDKPNWSILEGEVSTMFKRTPNFSTLLGCLEPLEKKIVVKRQHVKRDALAPTSRPEAVVTIDKEDDSIEKTVEKIKKLVSEHHSKAGSPIEYFRLVLNPENFGATIQNMLYMAFLVRDGIVKLVLDDSGNFVVVPCSKDAKVAAKKERKDTVQNLMSLDPAEWRALIDAYQIKSPMIAFR